VSPTKSVIARPPHLTGQNGRWPPLLHHISHLLRGGRPSGEEYFPFHTLPKWPSPLFLRSFLHWEGLNSLKFNIFPLRRARGEIPVSVRRVGCGESRGARSDPSGLPGGPDRGGFEERWKREREFLCETKQRVFSLRGLSPLKMHSAWFVWWWWCMGRGRRSRGRGRREASEKR